MGLNADRADEKGAGTSAFRLVRRTGPGNNPDKLSTGSSTAGGGAAAGGRRTLMSASAFSWMAWLP